MRGHGVRAGAATWIAVLLIAVAGGAWAQVIVRPYVGFTLWVDCERRGPVFFHYNLGPDLRNIPSAAYRSYKSDPQLPDRCQPLRTSAYSGNTGPAYERGHLVPINHLDSNPEAASDTAHMVNILPQTRILNRGAWGETEEIAECAREQQSILVIGGVIWGDDDSDDYWISTDDHGLRTPDGYWKALIRGSHAIAWLFDNSHDPAVAGTDALDSRIRTLEQIAEVALLPIEFPAALMTEQSNPDAWRNDCSAAVLS